MGEFLGNLTFQDIHDKDILQKLLLDLPYDNLLAAHSSAVENFLGISSIGFRDKNSSLFVAQPGTLSNRFTLLDGLEEEGIPHHPPVVAFTSTTSSSSGTVFSKSLMVGEDILSHHREAAIVLHSEQFVDDQLLGSFG